MVKMIANTLQCYVRIRDTMHSSIKCENMVVV